MAACGPLDGRRGSRALLPTTDADGSMGIISAKVLTPCLPDPGILQAKGCDDDHGIGNGMHGHVFGFQWWNGVGRQT